MREPVARPTKKRPQHEEPDLRSPKAYTPPTENLPVETFVDPEDTDNLPLVAPRPKKHGWWGKLFWAAGGLLVSLGLGLAAERLIRDLFARYEFLGWVGLAALVLFLVALLILLVREALALVRLSSLDALRKRATDALAGNRADDGKQIVAELQNLYAPRADLAQPRKQLDLDTASLLDGQDFVTTAERRLMAPLDARAKALTAASSRRVALVTAVSPRALVDLAFVGYESVKLARAIAELYGARPGLLGTWRLAGAVLSHLAITGGVALGDSVVQQLLGHGLAARLSARLGEGLVNGLMTVRVGIAAMRVTRPLPYEALPAPKVMDFMADLGRITKNPADTD